MTSSNLLEAPEVKERVASPNSEGKHPKTLHRSLRWWDAFWFASGVPVLVLFTVGAIASTAGNISSVVWIISIVFGFLQCFTYAEIAGMFPKKSGGASVYGAMAWVRYGKMLGPISVWSNWFSWSPVLAIGSGLAAGFILNMLFPPTSIIRTWQFTILDLGFIQHGLAVRINSTFLIGLALVLTVFSIQHRGIAKAAKIQRIVAISALLPILLIGAVPLFTGDIPISHFTPFVPLSHSATGSPIPGQWNLTGWTVFMGGLFIAAWSTYPFETAVCYVSEFKNPGKDTIRAMLSSGLLCLVVFIIVPVSFQAYLGLDGLLDPGIYDGTKVAAVMAKMIGAGPIIQNVVVSMLILSLALVIMTAMAGSSRTLYQGSHDGWLPKYLSRINDHGAPVAAMWTDLCFNIFLLMLSDYVFLLVLANVTYMIFVFLNLQAGWMHRVDRPEAVRPYRCPTWLLAIGSILGFANLFILGMGAGTWGKNALLVGLLVAAGIIPVFAFRHYIRDKGKFPATMYEDMELEYGSQVTIQKKCGMLPYLTLILGGLTIYLGNYLATY